MNSPTIDRTNLATRFWRRLAKLPVFLLRTHAWRTARWLAVHDASLADDFRGVSADDLAAAWRATGHWADLRIHDTKVYSRTLGLSLHSGSIAVKGYATLRLLAQRGFKFATVEDHIAVTTENLHLRVTNGEEIEMLREIFLEGCYDLRLFGDWTVLDVGANVGFAALAFARQPWVGRVMAFEPFAPTADGLAANVALNPNLASKILLHQFAWSDRDETLTVDYHRDRSGSMRLDGLGDFGGDSASRATPETIQVQRASGVFGNHIKANPGRPVLIKLDCEGSEFPILRDLESAGCLPRVDAFLIEWHYQPPDEIAERLQRAGFSLQIRPVRESTSQGILFAWRQAS